MRAILLLEDGTCFEGESIGRPGRCIGEVVFSTAMTGYQEMITDPSYRGQILTLTYPLIGNYGTASGDFESDHAQVQGLVVKELCDAPSNWRSDAGAWDFLRKQGVIGIAGVDTRALTRRLRVRGVMMGAISTEDKPEQLAEHIRRAQKYGEIDFVAEVSTQRPYQFTADYEKGSVQTELGFGDGPCVVVVDYGVKRNILRSLLRLGCEVMVVPAKSTAEQVLALKPDGVLFSPGPGDPALLGYAIEMMRDLLGKRPVMGVCLGHQLLAWAVGGKTFKLKFGHRGANHPVKDEASGRVFITSQNHGYAVDPDSLKGTGAEVTQINLNDGTVEGLRHEKLGAWSIQYHPEASPGPLDNGYLFDRFVEQLRKA